MKIRTFIFSILLMLASAVSAGEPAVVKPSDPAITYVGRFSEDYRFGWSASQFRFKIDGTSATALFSLTGGKEAGLLVIIDGVPAAKKLIVKKGQKEYKLAENLPAGEHLIEVCKTSEGSIGEVKFEGLNVPEGAKLSAAPLKERRILVIGDSITCGYGNEAKEEKDGNNVNIENAWFGYAMVAGRAVDADVETICWSGRGIYRNRSMKNDQEETVPLLFDRILPTRDKPKSDPKHFVPQVIVINLGTNDLFDAKGKKPKLTGENYKKACSDFVKKLREYYPEAKLILAMGPMRVKPMLGWLEELSMEVPDSTTISWKRIYEKKYFGGHGHPSVEMDAVMAKPLSEKIKEVTGWPIVKPVDVVIPEKK